jgi:hypothetical protein
MIFILLFFLLLGNSVAHASVGVADLVYQSSGARAMAMGTAFTAVADDSSYPFWNPAGLHLQDVRWSYFDFQNFMDFNYHFSGSTIVRDGKGLLGGQNIEITYEKRNIEGTVKDCIVFGLAKSNLPDLYATFAGPCGNRPESNTCDRQPIRRINDVDPDLYGIITLIVDDSSGIITGSTEIVSSELVGVQLDTPVSFDDICTKTAAFPTTYDDLCYPQTHPEPQPHTSSSAVGYSSSAVGMSSSVPVSKTYMFDDALELNDWVAFAGTGSTYIQNWNVTALDAFNSTTAL